MIILGGEIASEVSRRQTELASITPKTVTHGKHKMRSKPSETHRIVISLATETTLLLGVGRSKKKLSLLI